MNEYPLKKFIDLIDYDQSIRVLQKQLEQYMHDIDTASNEINMCNESLHNMKATKLAYRKEVDAKELEMKSFDEEEKKKKAKLDQAVNHHEYESIKSEIDSLKKKQQALEEDLVAAWRRFENFESEYQAKKKFCDTHTQVHDQVIKNKMIAVEAIKKDLTAHAHARLEKEKGIPAEWLERYAVMKESVHNPVVPLNHESCSACFYRVPQKNLVELRKGKLIVCTDCFRFLYVKEHLSESPGAND